MRDSGRRQPQPLLSERDAALAGAKLYLSAQAIAGAMGHGRHVSRSRGVSTEFYDFRQYAPGDPARLIDWRALARTDRLYLRRFHHETQLSVMILLDATASMDFTAIDNEPARKPSRPSKLWRAKELAAAVALLAISQGDRAGITVAGCDSEGSRPTVIPPGEGREALRGVVGLLEETRPGGQSGGAAAALRDALTECERLLPRGGLLVVITDALDETRPLLDALARLRFAPGHAREVALLQVITADELDPSRAGRAIFVDPETGERSHFVRGGSEAFRRAVARHLSAVRSGVRAMHGRYGLALTHQAPVEALREAFGR